MIRERSKAAATTGETSTGRNGDTAAEEPKEKEEAKATTPCKNGKETAAAVSDGEPSVWEVAFYALCFVSVVGYAAVDFNKTYGRPLSDSLPGSNSGTDKIVEYEYMQELESLESKLIKYYKYLIATSVVFLLISQTTLRWTSRTTHYLAIVAYSLVLTAVAVGTRAAIFLLLLYSGAVFMGYFSLLGVWLLTLAVMLLQNSEYEPEIFRPLNLDGQKRQIFAPISGYLYCRCISAGHCINRVVQRLRMQESGPPTLLQFMRQHLPKSLAYGFYLPWHYCGPILTYDNFCHEVDRPDRTDWNLRLAASLTWRACRLLFWFFVLQTLHRILPVASFLDSLESDGNPVIFRHVAIAMYLHGQNFMLVYLQLYGWPGLLARIDGIRLLEWPDCISRVYTYRKMWRVFDRGLASFLQHHIYIPMGGSKRGVFRQVAGILLSFAFVSVYHGDSWGIRAWAALNAFHLLLESAISAAYQRRIKGWLDTVVSPSIHQRLIAAVICLNLVISSCTIFIFLFPLNAILIVTEIVKPFASQGSRISFAIGTYLCYCVVQMTKYYERRVIDKDKIE